MPALDLDPESRRALEFDELLRWIAGSARTGVGAARVLELEPSADEGRVTDELATVEELRRRLREEGAVLGSGLPDPAPALRALAVEGLPVEPRVLRALAAVLVAAADVRRTLGTLDAARCPRLRRLGSAVPDLGREAAPVVRHVEPDGRVLDSASAELRRIRAAAARVAERLRERLERLLHAPDASATIQDEFITTRNGRFVIPVRTDAARPVRGIVHATSSSGATRFVEPLEAVEPNNELVRLGEAEEQEAARVVAGWADGLRVRLGDVSRAIEGIAEVDAFQARATFAEELDAVAPAIAPAGDFVLRGIRHPLLERHLRERGATCEPLQLELRPADRVLVLSGPNAGGKTVALKTFGLAVLMGQAGIPVLASDARLPLVRQVRADIGDHQSIEADLSTYSAHVRAVGTFLRDATPPALFLFDEIGGGTEPAEGAALAQAILERLRAPGMTVIATTHQGALKRWALTTEGVSCAAMEFDPRTLRATYRILADAAGVSAGLDVAEKLGLERAIVDQARTYLDPDARRGEAYLARLHALTADAERRLDELARRERELDAERRRVEEEARERETRWRERVQGQLRSALEELRALGRREIAAIRGSAERQRAERGLRKVDERLAREAARAGAAAGGPPEPDRGAPCDPAALGPGSIVHVRSLGRDGEVVRLRGQRVEVRLGRVSFTVDLQDLSHPVGAPPAPAPAPRSKLPPPRPAPSGPDPDGLGAAAPGREIKLIGMTVDEATEALDRFLDRALVAGLTEVRVIHGYGTGRLRAAVRRFLAAHAQVEASRPAAPEEGGDGATIARLR